MSFLDDDTFDWHIIYHVDKWLDEKIPNNYKAEPMAQDWARIAKVIEELGEAIQAMIGATGQNPRKGATHTQKDMLYELADTAMTAVLAIQHFTKDTEETRDILRNKQKFIYRRMIESNGS